MRIFLFSLFQLWVFSNLSANEIPVNSKISTVTVYRSGAKLSNVATVKLPAGNAEVVFENLSPYFNANSLQVKINGSATLVSAVFRLKTPGPAPENPRAGVLRDSLVLLGDEFVRIRDEREVLGEENNLISESSKRLGTTPTGQSTMLSLNDLKDMAAYYRQRVLEIKSRLLELAIKERKLNELYKSMQAVLTRLQPNTSNSTGEIALKIESASAQSVEITCTYLITQAGWAPLYDLRSDGLDKDLRLVYKANVMNNSGFDWKGIQLHLSSAQPLANNNRPILTPIFADFRTVAVYYPPNDAKLQTYNMAQIAQKPATDGGDVKEKGARNKDTNYYIDGVRVEGAPPAVDDMGGISDNSSDNFITQFDLSKPQDILADGKENIITVQEQNMPVQYEYHTVPKLDPSVFLLAKVTDYGKYGLLPGTANLFFQETFVGQAFVNPQTISDTLLLSLGRDEQLTVKRVQPQDLTGRKKVFDKNIKETYSYEITIKNNKSVPVKVHVIDEIPVSKQEEIKIELEEKSGASYNETFGKLSWDVDIPAGQNKKVQFSYSMKYPKDKQVAIIKG